VLWVGMTAPKQETWIEAHRGALRVPVIGAIGAVFDFYAGTRKRAPQWVCDLGLEWLPRLLREPGRLWRRNVISTPVFLARARQGSRAHGLTPRYAAADMRALPFRDASFDAVVNLDSSLGLFLADAEDVRALAEARRVLRPGGRFLLETMHRDDVVANFASRDAWTLPDGTEVRVRRRFDPVQGISHESLRWQHGRQKGRTRSAFRVRTATELDGLLRAAGLRPLLWRGGWDGSPFRRRSERLIVVAGLD